MVRIDNPVRTIGLFTSIVFLAGALLTSAMHFSWGWDISKIATDPYQLSQLGFSILFYLSSRSRRMFFVQPVLFLIIAPINFLDSHDSFYGLGFFVMAVLLLFKIGFFNKHKIVKFISLLVYLYGWELFAAFRSGRSKGHSLTPVFFVTAFLVSLYILYQENIIVYLKQPKPILDLRAKGLSETESLYIISIDRGKSPKEIAAEHKISASTVRNTLARAYKKLSVKDRAGLSSLIAQHTLKG